MKDRLAVMVSVFVDRNDDEEKALFINHAFFLSFAEGRELAKHFGCRFIETSAKQRINVDEAFSNLVREIRRYNKDQEVGRPGIGGAGPTGGERYPTEDKHDSGCCRGCVVL